MATKTTKNTDGTTDTVQSENISNGLFGEVESIPKKAFREGFGRKADDAKVAHLTNIFTSFAEFAGQHPMEKGQQVPITELGKWTPSQLEVLGNSLLQRQRDNGNDPGFYLVATDLVHDGETKTGKPKMVPTKLVIRVGQRPTRNRKPKTT